MGVRHEQPRQMRVRKVEWAFISAEALTVRATER
jgi:hypothetical protein